jgi:hypothetical protein
VSGYRLDDEVRSPAEAEDFSCSLCVQTTSADHPAFCLVDIGGPFSGVKHGGGVALTAHPHLVPRARMSRSSMKYLNVVHDDFPQCPSQPTTHTKSFCRCLCTTAHPVLSNRRPAGHIRPETTCKQVRGIMCYLILVFFSPEGGVGLVPKCGCLLTLAYYAFPK